MSLVVWQAATLLFLVAWPLHNILVALATRRRRSATTRAEGLHFWIVIPALNEEVVISNTVTAALAMDAPETPIQVVVVDDASTDGTPAKLAEITDPRLHVIRRELPDARRGKGQALNAGYRYIRDQSNDWHRAILGVIDGDGRAEPGQLAVISSAFADPRVDAVQGRVRIHNRVSILGLLQDIEFSCVADASQQLRDRLGSVGLGGNGQFVRIAALAQFDDKPWSSCLVEDLELGLRLHLKGGMIRYQPKFTITQQGLVDLRRLLRQRARWAQGNLQCARYVSGLFGSHSVGSIGLLDFLQYLVAPWLMIPISILVVAAAGLTTAALATGTEIPILAADPDDIFRAITIWFGALLLPGFLWSTIHWLRYRDEHLLRCLVAGFIYPAFLLLGIVASWRAMIRHIGKTDNWVKTERTADPAMSNLT